MLQWFSRETRNVSRETRNVSRETRPVSRETRREVVTYFWAVLYPFSFPFHCSVQKHAKEHKTEHPMAAKEVSENMHINNIPTSAPEDGTAVKLMNELCNLLSKGGIQLTKYAACFNQIQVPLDRYHGRCQENVAPDQAQMSRSEQSQVPVERSAYLSYLYLYLYLSYCILIGKYMSFLGSKYMSFLGSTNKHFTRQN